MQTIHEIENSVRNQILDTDRSFHSWYQFVLSYPPHLVRYYLMKFGVRPGEWVLDPFCGTGTTNVECKKLDINNLGVEANPLAYFAARVKIGWRISVEEIREAFGAVIGSTIKSFEKFGLAENVSLFVRPKNGKSLGQEPKLTPDQLKVMPKNFISARPLRKILILKDCIKRIENKSVRDLFLLALANITVNDASNLAFGPEVYATKPKKDARVLDAFYKVVDTMILDIESGHDSSALSEISFGDSREIGSILTKTKARMNYVITSPPYPNEKDYTRTTRLESIILDLISSKENLRSIKERLLRSNSRNVFVADNDSEFVKGFDSITKLAGLIEEKRILLGKTSGFEKLYSKIVKHYFGGMYRHLQSMKSLLAPNCRLAYVVGDQMSFFRTNIPTAKILAEIAESLGYRVLEIELWRTRLATVTRKQLDENVLILSL